MTVRAKLPDGVYEFTIVTPPAGNGPRVRISGTTYEIVSVDPADATATPVRFNHPTEGTLAWAGGKIPILYIHKMGSTFQPTDAFTWEEADLSGYGVPPNHVAEIRIEYPGVYADGDLEGIAGARQTGSALSRLVSIQPYLSGRNTVTFCVNVDADCKIEIYSNYLTGLTTVPKSQFRVLGYYENATYTETIITLDTTADAWDTDTLFASHGIPKGSVIEVVMGCVSNDYNRVIGLRQTGAAGRSYNMARGSYGSGGRWVRVFETTSVANGEVDTYVSTDSSYNTHRCMGYWDLTVGYTLVGTTYAPANPSAWENKNIGLAYRKIANVVMYNTLTTGTRTVGVRADGSALDRFHGVERARSTYISMWTACVEVVGAGIVEIYSSNITEAQLIVDGYLGSV